MDIMMNLLQHMKSFTAQAHVLKTMRVHGKKEKRMNLQPSISFNIEVNSDRNEEAIREQYILVRDGGGQLWRALSDH